MEDAQKPRAISTVASKTTFSNDHNDYELQETIGKETFF